MDEEGINKLCEEMELKVDSDVKANARRLKLKLVGVYRTANIVPGISRETIQKNHYLQVFTGGRSHRDAQDAEKVGLLVLHGPVRENTLYKLTDKGCDVVEALKKYA